jgi:hypothetical protein
MARQKIGQLLELERLRLGRRRNLQICSDLSRLIFLVARVGCGVKSIGFYSEIYGSYHLQLLDIILTITCESAVAL